MGHEGGQQAADGGGREFDRVADELRHRMTGGVYPLGSLMPAQRDLAQEFGVSRDTVQRVLRELRNEGWIESRQGSGSRVVKVQRIQSTAPKATRSRQAVTLGPLISEAFEQPEVTLDVYTLTSETLDAHIRLQAERIRAHAIVPQRIALRMLLPYDTESLPYPRGTDAKHDPLLRDRLRDITGRHTDSLRGVLAELTAEGLVPEIRLEVRYAPLTPAFKLYLINGVEALHGMYEVIRRPVVVDRRKTVEALDVLGLGATLTHHVRDGDPNSPGSTFVESMQNWFDSVWQLLSEESPAVR
ncbi:GntR family transcriptional regulator [Streptomyces lacrimifluminis]|uniref:GntR family transcriptional regulator n=1 Tax=Streptomyces lacrimifluminis TaxID=1500077 RepID=A0A917KDG5_9ACTN|nr:winged helix-turn-helix domain-containing protein [Streptomyces lacrimifluminis]GGJ07943.1 GntR family transcriptional regulator [Streptomyces lacrimifluminis]